MGPHINWIVQHCENQNGFNNATLFPSTAQYGMAASCMGRFSYLHLHIAQHSLWSGHPIRQSTYSYSIFSSLPKTEVIHLKFLHISHGHHTYYQLPLVTLLCSIQHQSENQWSSISTTSVQHHPGLEENWPNTKVSRPDHHRKTEPIKVLLSADCTSVTVCCTVSLKEPSPNYKE